MDLNFGAGLRALPPVERWAVDPTLHRLQWNESALPFPPALKEEIVRRLLAAEWERYPTALRPFALIDRLAAHLAIDPERLLIGAGSSDLIRVTLGALLRPGDAIVLPAPTFLLYKRNARVLEATLHECVCRADEEFALPVEALLEAAHRGGARVVALCAPNNPTGTVHPVAALETLAAGLAGSGCALVIDEAYQEFSGQDLLPLALAHPHVILLRTFSKAYRMAGVRVGYAVAAPAAARELQKAVTSFPISFLQEAIALTVLDHAADFAAGAAQIVAERERLAAALRALPGVHVYGSGANFLLLRLPMPSGPVVEHLRTQQRVLVGDGAGYPELENVLRVSVGTPAQNDLVVQGVAECL